jgi:lambda repressor-like predicted transcriptional regulator
MKTRSPAEIIRRAIKTLDKQYCNVLSMHYGLNGNPGSSLESLSEQLGKSVDTLNTVEITAIRKLRHPKVGKNIIKAMQMADQEIWLSLADENNVVYTSTLTRQVENHLPGELLIGIKCLYSNVNSWLLHHASRNFIGWFRSETPERTVFETVGRLKRLQKRVLLPLPFQRVADILKVDEKLLKQVVALSINRVGIYRDYITNRPIASRTLRTIRLHLMMTYRYPDKILPLDKIHAEYIRTYTDDDLTMKDINYAMTDNPHIFLRIGNMGWYSILKYAGGNPYKKSANSIELKEPDENKEIYFIKRPWKETPTIGIIKRFFAAKGACRPSEAAKMLIESSELDMEENAFVPMIVQSPDFIQLSPTVYALRKDYDNPDPVNAGSDYLLTKSDVRWYILSRYAGEPMNTYPFWTPAMEMKWCHWAEKHAVTPQKSRLFHSLLYVADPCSWPTSDDEIERWLEMKKWDGYYYMEFNCKHQLWHKIPPLQDILKLIICVSQTGSMNWIRVNRASGYYTFDQHSITSLALLIAFDIVQPAKHWQQTHKIGTKADVMKKKLLDGRQETVSQDWASPLGHELRQCLHEIDPGKKLGWVSEKDLTLLIRKLDGKEIELNVASDKKENKKQPRPQKQLELPFC